jgi:hypothetical protein
MTNYKSIFCPGASNNLFPPKGKALLLSTNYRSGSDPSPAEVVTAPAPPLWVVRDRALGTSMHSSNPIRVGTFQLGANLAQTAWGNSWGFVLEIDPDLAAMSKSWPGRPGGVTQLTPARCGPRTLSTYPVDIFITDHSRDSGATGLEPVWWQWLRRVQTSVDRAAGLGGRQSAVGIRAHSQTCAQAI